MITTLSEDDTKRTIEPVQAPRWDAVEAALRRLDNHRFTMVGLSVDEDHYMLVGGGAGTYVCTIHNRDEDLNLLVSGGATGDPVTIVAGQGTEYPTDEVVDLPTVLAAVRAYYTTGVASSQLDWRRY